MIQGAGHSLHGSDGAGRTARSGVSLVGQTGNAPALLYGYSRAAARSGRGRDAHRLGQRGGDWFGSRGALGGSGTAALVGRIGSNSAQGAAYVIARARDRIAIYRPATG